MRGTPEHASVELKDGAAPVEAPIVARLAAVADGTGETMPSIARRRRDYGQVALVAKLWPAAPHEGLAFERFTPDGPMALLPENDRYGLVWTATPDRARDLLALDDSDFLAELARRFGARAPAHHEGRRSPHVSARARIRRRARARALRCARQRGADAASGRGTGIQPRAARRVGARDRRARFPARARSARPRCSGAIRAAGAPIECPASRSRTHSSACSATIYRSFAGREGWHSLCSTPFRRRSAHSRTRCCSAFASRTRREATPPFPKSVPLCATSRERKSRAHCTHHVPRNGYNPLPAAISTSVFRSSLRAHRSLRHRQQSRRRADGRRHRSPVSPAVQAARRGVRGVGDGRVESRPVEHAEIAAAHRPSRRGGTDRRADRRRRSAMDGRRRALQRRARRADHRHQHGVPGQEGLQRGRGLRAPGERAARRVDRRRRRARGRRAGHAQDPHGYRPRAPQRARDRADRRGVRASARSPCTAARAPAPSSARWNTTRFAPSRPRCAFPSSRTATSAHRSRRRSCSATRAPTRS